MITVFDIRSSCNQLCKLLHDIPINEQHPNYKSSGLFQAKQQWFELNSLVNVQEKKLDFDAASVQTVHLEDILTKIKVAIQKVPAIKKTLGITLTLIGLAFVGAAAWARGNKPQDSLDA